MNFLGLSVIGAAVISVLLGILGANYEKKDEALSYQESQSMEMPTESAASEMTQE